VEMGPLRAPSRTYQISFIPSCISRLPPVNCLSFRNRSDVTFEYVVLRALFTVPISPRRAVFVSETRTMDLRFPRILDRCLTCSSYDNRKSIPSLPHITTQQTKRLVNLTLEQ